ncbi:hypothetical protein KIL84_020770 [Mauremys mutica]|uniref:Uncharacterized protein n=1 Tax=Mauremys mutica TaxID=74926 RepID=A0A9D3XAK1_9SAUR|nr:hypothetical protein KIL84_020770 [Mauremys mutica]
MNGQGFKRRKGELVLTNAKPALKPQLRDSEQSSERLMFKFLAKVTNIILDLLLEKSMVQVMEWGWQEFKNSGLEVDDSSQLRAGIKHLLNGAVNSTPSKVENHTD